MERVFPAAEFARHVRRYQMLAQRDPVAVTSHGRTTGLFRPEAFKLFRESRRSFATTELPAEKADATAASQMDVRHAS